MMPAMKKPCQRWKVDWACWWRPCRRRSSAAGSRSGAGPQADHHGGQTAAASWRCERGFGGVGRRAGQRRVHGADTIEPRKKIRNQSAGLRRPTASVRCGPSAARVADSLAAQVKTPRAMVEVARGGPGGEDLLACPRDALVVRAGQPGVLGQVAGQAQGRAPPRRVGLGARASSSRARSARAPAPPASSASSAARARSGAGLQGGRIAVPPAAVLAPDRVDDELGLVVDGLEEGALGQGGGDPHGVDGVVEPPARVHDGQRLVDQRVEEVGRVGEGGADPVGPDDREAVAGQQELGVERRACGAGRPPTPGGSAAPSGDCRRWARPR